MKFLLLSCRPQSVASLAAAVIALTAAPWAMAQPGGGRHCASGEPMRIRGDVPGAISFDVYRQLRPLSAQRLALFSASGQVARLPDGMPVCQIVDDGVDDPSAALVRSPTGRMAWWVAADDLAHD